MSRTGGVCECKRYANLILGLLIALEMPVQKNVSTLLTSNHIFRFLPTDASSGYRHAQFAGKIRCAAAQQHWCYSARIKKRSPGSFDARAANEISQTFP